jgi:hypothetical protein
MGLIELADRIDTHACRIPATCCGSLKETELALRDMAASKGQTKQAVERFATPAGATWAEVQIRFVDGHRVSVQVRDLARVVYSYSDMGMADQRNKNPTRQRDLLREFARGYGVITWDSPAAHRKNQKRRETLAKNLKSFFGIEGEPIELTENRKGWRTAFSLEPEHG